MSNPLANSSTNKNLVELFSTSGNNSDSATIQTETSVYGKKVSETNPKFTKSLSINIPSTTSEQPDPQHKAINEFRILINPHLSNSHNCEPESTDKNTKTLVPTRFVEDVKAELNAGQEHIDSLTNTNTSLNNKTEALKKENSILTDKINSMEREVNEILDDEAITNNRDVRAFTENLKLENSQILKLTKSVDQLTTKKNELETNLSKTTNQLNSTKIDIKSLKSSISEKDDILNKTKKEFQKTIKELQEQVTSLKQQILELKNKLSDKSYEETIQSIEKKNTELTEKSNTLESKTEELEKKLSQANTLLESTEAAKKNLEEEVTELKNKLNSSENSENTSEHIEISKESEMIVKSEPESTIPNSSMEEKTAQEKYIPLSKLQEIITSGDIQPPKKGRAFGFLPGVKETKTDHRAYSNTLKNSFEKITALTYEAIPFEQLAGNGSNIANDSNKQEPSAPRMEAYSQSTKNQTTV
ncbi:hypothetical protein [uncultured Endozoicomonas sp.]|uniref:coiled-coil domain-containing protein n=1 Tax=uncultured Endozoicomonas sp. TaxID=432652 RepID=UPI002605E151|nr:hypothetical protein [uncultured Endozoicomonas sp.]